MNAYLLWVLWGLALSRSTERIDQALFIDNLDGSGIESIMKNWVKLPDARKPDCWVHSCLTMRQIRCLCYFYTNGKLAPITEDESSLQ